MRYTSDVIRDIYNDTKYPSENTVNQSIPDRENFAILLIVKYANIS